MSDDWLMVLIEKFSAKFEQTLLYGTTVHEWIQYVLLEFMRLVFVIIATPKTIKQQFTTISVGVYHLLSFCRIDYYILTPSTEKSCQDFFVSMICSISSSDSKAS